MSEEFHPSHHLPDPIDSASSGPALAAVRAMVEAALQPMAVFDETGACLAANRGFALRAASGPAPAEQRSRFSPAAGHTWTLACSTAWPAAAGSVPLMDMRTIDFIDSVANALPLMFNAKDRQSRYLFMNRYQARLYGVTPETAVGATAAELLGADYGAYARGLDAEVLQTGRGLPFYEESYAVADGNVRRWLTSKMPLGSEGAIWGVATVSVDITERTQLEQGLRQAKEAAEAASRAKSGFLAAMSHELRTPLNAVIGFAEIIHQQVLGPIGSPEYGDYAGHILASGQQLLALINDILDFARLEAGRLQLSVAPVELGGLLRGVTTVLEPGALHGGIRLELLLPSAPVELRADAARLRQALLHVGGNALKFTPREGRVTIALRTRGSGATITVEDSGVGISAEDLPHLFEPFWQADSGHNRLRQGAGIGLKLARQLVLAHGGELAVRSTPGAGTMVTLELLANPPQAAIAAS